MKLIKTIFLFILFPCLLSSQDTPENALEPMLGWFSEQAFNVRDFTLSPDADEIYFTVESYKRNISFIVVSKNVNDDWTQPEVVSFSGKYRDIEPAFAPDGKTLYFASNRPLNNAEGTPKDYDIWMVNRTDKRDKWSEPVNLGNPVNSDKDEFFPSVTSSGNLYFTATLEETKGREDIYVCEYKDGKYSPPRSLDTTINTQTYEFNAWVAPNESLIIFSSFARKDGNGGGDLYFSKKDDSGKWQAAQNFGTPVNSDKLDYCPFYDFKTQTLYFTSERTSVKKHYEKPLSFKDFLKEISQTENGLGRIYKVSFDFEG